MSVDRHQVWRQLRAKVELLHELRPDGFGIVVEVYVLGRDDPIQLGVVETSRAEDRPWSWVQAAGSVRSSVEESERRPHPDGEWLLLPEQHIVRIELRYVPDIEAPEPPEFREADGDPADATED